MDQLDSMRVFLRVAELASFTQAADSLGLTKASISAAVQRLEGQLGTRLLHRTTRRVRLTQDGQAYYERCRDLLSDVEELQSLFRRDEARLTGRLRVDMPASSARQAIIPRLPEFLAQHPGLEMDLSSTDRRVDVVREGFDCVLRAGTLDESSLVARPLGALRQISCASPAYLARHGTPGSLDDLARHQLIHYTPVLGGKSPGFEYLGPDGMPRTLAMAGAVTVNNSDAYTTACLAGLGLIQSPEAGLRGLLQRGELVQVLPGQAVPSLPLNLLYANRRHLPRRVRVFMDWLDLVMREHNQDTAAT
ncbi:UNVERIFIED_CONTAM: yhjC [Trichonephila clavipes]